MQPLVHSLTCEAAKATKRRTFLTIFAGASTCLLAPVFANARALAPGHVVMLRCLATSQVHHGSMAARRTVRSAWCPTPVRASAEPVAPASAPLRCVASAIFPARHGSMGAQRTDLSAWRQVCWPAVQRRPMARRGRRRRRYCVPLSRRYSRSATARRPNRRGHDWIGVRAMSQARGGWCCQHDILDWLTRG